MLQLQIRMKLTVRMLPVIIILLIILKTMTIMLIIRMMMILDFINGTRSRPTPGNDGNDELGDSNPP